MVPKLSELAIWTFSTGSAGRMIKSREKGRIRKVRVPSYYPARADNFISSESLKMAQNRPQKAKAISNHYLPDFDYFFLCDFAYLWGL
jgi:hypothetical protein